MMPKGIRRCLALTMLAVAGLFFTGCSSTQPPSKGGVSSDSKNKNDDKALLYVDKKLLGLGTKKVYAYPDPLKIKGYGDGTTERKVTWIYLHTSTTITFKDEDVIGKVECLPGTGVCTAKLKGDLIGGCKDKKAKDKCTFRYTVSGEEGNEKLKDNDPDLEVDR